VKEPVAKKASVNSGLSSHVEKLCDQVNDAILGSPEYSPEVKKMLANGIIGSLAVPKEKRHAFQDSTVDMIRQVVDSLQAAAQSKLDEAERRLETTVKENEEHQNAVEAAAATLAERTKMADAAKTRYGECTMARVAAKEALNLAERKQTIGNAGLSVTALKKQRLESGMETIYGPLKRGDMPAAEVQEGIRQIEKLGKDIGFDATLLQSVPGPLAKQPSERGSFDIVVVSQIEAELQRFMVTFTEELSNGELAKKERATNVEVASSDYATALSAEEAAKAEREAARTAHRNAETEHQALVNSVTTGRYRQGSASLAVRAAKTELKEIDEGPLAAFKELLELTEIPQSPAQGEPVMA